MNQPLSSAQNVNMARPSPHPANRVPKSGQFIDTRHGCFNAATTPVIRIPDKAVND